MKLKEMINTVTMSPSSIFTKEDVIKLMTSIEVEVEPTEPSKPALTQENLEDIASAIANRLYHNSGDFCELESVTVSVGSYGNGIDDASFSVDEDNIQEIVMKVLEDNIDVVEEEETEEA